MLSQMLVFNESKNFTSGRWILAPPTVPINHEPEVIAYLRKNPQGILTPFREPEAGEFLHLIKKPTKLGLKVNLDQISIDIIPC